MTKTNTDWAGNDGIALQRLNDLCISGLKERYVRDLLRIQDGALAATVQERLNQELQAIANKSIDFVTLHSGVPISATNYFLVLADLAQFARERDIPFSAFANCSLVCYGLYISDVCPLKYGLLFERMAHELSGIPEIWCNVCIEGEPEMVRHLRDKYGEEVAEHFVLLKLDRLTVLQRAIALVKETTGVRLRPDQFLMDDPATYALLSRGDTEGIHYIGGRHFTECLKQLKPKNIRDLMAAIALCQPGLLESGMFDLYVATLQRHRAATPMYPAAEAVLEETHGLLLYEEQVMEVLNCIGGFTFDHAWRCYLEVSKREQGKIEQLRSTFIEGAAGRGIGVKDATQMFELIEKFGPLGLKAKFYATTTALLAYQMAYVKAHYPAEFARASNAYPITLPEGSIQDDQ